MRPLSSVQVSDSCGASFFFLFLLVSCLCNCCLHSWHFYSAWQSHWMQLGYLCKCFSSRTCSAESDLLLLPSASNLSLPSFLSHCFSFHFCLPAVRASSQRRKWGRAASAGVSAQIAAWLIISWADQGRLGTRSDRKNHSLPGEVNVSAPPVSTSYTWQEL